MISLIFSIIGTISGGFLKLITGSTLGFLGFKALLSTLFIVVMPVVINNLMHGFIQESINVMNSVDVGGGWVKMQA